MTSERAGGFEERWNPPRTRWLTPEALISARTPAQRARLARVVRGAPEVFLRVTSHPRTARALREHLDYISRGGEIRLEERSGDPLTKRQDLLELAEDWIYAAQQDSHRRTTRSPVAQAMVFALPPGQDPEIVRRAAKGFLDRRMAGHDYVLAEHTDRPHPHVHAAVRWLGDQGRRIASYRQVALDWREQFAEEVRRLGLEAEATPRWARGVVRGGDSYVVRKIQERFVEGQGAPAEVHVDHVRQAARALDRRDFRPTEAERAAFEKQAKVRALYKELAEELARAHDARDRSLSVELNQFVARLPPPASRRMLLMRDMVQFQRERQPGLDRER